MNLSELKMKVDKAVEHAKECGQDINSIEVSLQLDGPGDGSVFSSECVKLHYDNDGCASGCVLTANI